MYAHLATFVLYAVAFVLWAFRAVPEGRINPPVAKAGSLHHLLCRSERRISRTGENGKERG